MTQQREERRILQSQDWNLHVFMLLFVVPSLAAGLWLVHPLVGLVVVAVFALWLVDNVHESRRLLERRRQGRTR
jgi:hypothetical protein